MPEQDEIITIVDEENNEHDVMIYDIVELDGNRYAIVVPLIDDEEDVEDPDDEGDGDAFVLKIEQDEDGEDILVEIDDDEWEKVRDACMEVLEADEDDH
ncbi:DUF1292 domain-containing protein [Desulfoscipio gibsoniae]|uniref:Uncharacterized protein n=1 Tax=Desulfoscipio gibsoniae DSM 7213 TaxID=767817 RepID=R4KNG8_9FIRM|nr:DUF1292 domain-containing protein [Desulfoscipio gibsoniae]AGL02080.1 Protein of unknown function (DUF1292) [Desulfoscipio gibsoniae DSM 7213]